MDKSLDKALDFSNYMVTFNNQKRIIHEEYLEDLVVYQNGGKFTVDKELICFANHLNEKVETKVVLIDDNNIPVVIEDLQKFLHDITSTYSEASRVYYDKYKKMIDKRSVESLVNV
tara:strand:- start:37688 stop:38035 length:348 start_codon:yes stop_codon:yes gene_type:complete